MPEFEDTQPQQNDASQTYTPSTDASAKPRTRRRSGGFKKELTPLSSGKMGEVSAADALKQEKLSGSARAETRAEAETETEDAPRRPSRESRKPTPGRSDEPRRERRSDDRPRANRSAGDSESPRPRTRRPEADDGPRGNPQPSENTLAAIKRVEERLETRRAERDQRRKERSKDRPAKAERDDRKPRKPRENSGPRAQNSRSSAPATRASKAPQEEKGLIGAITGFFGSLFGGKSEPEHKEPEAKLREIRPGSRQNGGNGNNRRPGGSGSGNRGRGGQGRRSGGGKNRPRSESRSDT